MLCMPSLPRRRIVASPPGAIAIRIFQIGDAEVCDLN